MFWKVLRYASQHDLAVWRFLEASITHNISINNMITGKNVISEQRWKRANLNPFREKAIYKNACYDFTPLLIPI